LKDYRLLKEVFLYESVTLGNALSQNGMRSQHWKHLIFWLRLQRRETLQLFGVLTNRTLF